MLSSSPLGSRLVIRSKLEALLVAVAVALLVALLAEEVPRVLFPWDLRYFSESPFLTDMMKLSSGAGMYASPEDGNSYIYAPGLGYVTFAILRPFGAQLDIRACRAVSVAIGFASAAVAGGVVHRLLSLLGDRPGGRASRIIATCAAALLIFINYTADACHPDNLYGLHAMALIALTFAAIDVSSYRRAVLAISFAALGITVKQTAVLGLVGSAAVLIYFCGRGWGLARSALLVAWGSRSRAPRPSLPSEGGGGRGRSTSSRISPWSPSARRTSSSTTSTSRTGCACRFRSCRARSTRS